jgi:hypothetical protein
MIARITLCLAVAITASLQAQETRVELKPSMIVNETGLGEPDGLVDEQKLIIGPPTGKPTSSWKINSKHNRKYPFSVHLDLGKARPLSKLWIFDTNGKGQVEISTGRPGQWTKLTSYDCGSYLKWASVDLNVETRYVRLTKKTPGANFSEIAIYSHTPEAYKAFLAAKAEDARKAALRDAAIKKAIEEVKKRPLVDIGAPFGKLYLVDEIDCAKAPASRQFAEHPAGVSKVQTILGRKCRVIPPTAAQSAYFTYRIGKMKLLRPGASYVLAIDYPQDAPRTVIVSNTGNETIRGFHTGRTVGDAFHPKFVNNLNESLDVPLSKKWETWTQMFCLHDRFTEYNQLPRSGKPRTLIPEDGFNVTIVQFSARNIPMSKGAAAARIRLFAVIEPEKLAVKLRLPPKPLPHRRLFWREEMADGVIAGKTPETRGLKNYLDWYKFKAQRMRFLGMNTFSKDLLEFGANQGWDPTPHGGNNWVHFNSAMKDSWGQIVTLMGSYGFDILPYYEYSGSKGYKSLGYERRCKPLARSDGRYTHIKWIETANADITDPDTYEDFKKMLDLTVIRMRNKAKFAGIWLRPRSQLPVSFADGTLKRFAAEANKNEPVTREQIAKDKTLYARYINWWGTKRRDFLAAMRDYLRKNGVGDAMVLFTGCPAEPGVSFASWDPVMVSDTPDAWASTLKLKANQTDKKQIVKPITIASVVKEQLYLKGLLATGKDWGGYEIRHARPADDPEHYKQTDGVMLTHAFNRLYTVASRQTFDAYRAPGGLAAIRHYALNESMMFDTNDKPKLGYFVADIERAGPYCMMAEAVAVANGDPTMIGYLSGGNFARGFPRYVRAFNAAYLALPALPSSIVQNAASDSKVIVRRIKTPSHGTYFAIVNTAMTDRKDVSITLPSSGNTTDAATGIAIPLGGGKITLSLHPFELRAILVK